MTISHLEALLTLTSMVFLQVRFTCVTVSVKKKVFWFLPELLTDWVRVTLQVLILDSTCPYVSFYSSAIKGKN